MLRQSAGLGGEGGYLHRNRPTDRVNLHHLENDKVKEGGEGMDKKETKEQGRQREEGEEK